jgi:hypothetical protein
LHQKTKNPFGDFTPIIRTAINHPFSAVVDEHHYNFWLSNINLHPCLHLHHRFPNYSPTVLIVPIHIPDKKENHNPFQILRKEEDFRFHLLLLAAKPTNPKREKITARIAIIVKIGRRVAYDCPQMCVFAPLPSPYFLE